MIEVYDNFLPTEVFTPIKDYVFGGRMPWYYSPTSVMEGDGCPQFSHACYIDAEPISDVYGIIKPVLTKSILVKFAPVKSYLVAS